MMDSRQKAMLAAGPALKQPFKFGAKGPKKPAKKVAKMAKKSASKSKASKKTGLKNLAKLAGRKVALQG